MENQTSGRQPAFIIYDDGTGQQMIPVNIAFYEQAIRGLSAHVERLKAQMMIPAPMPEPVAEPVAESDE